MVESIGFGAHIDDGVIVGGIHEVVAIGGIEIQIPGAVGDRSHGVGGRVRDAAAGIKACVARYQCLPYLGQKTLSA